jgi:tetratricopeptide (TPR) repeat protein
VARRATGMLDVVRKSVALSCLFVPLLGLSVVACANRAPAALEVPAPPEHVGSIDEFEAALNRYVVLPDGDPAREAYREVLAGFLLGYLDDALETDNEVEAVAALRYAVGLYTPAELRTSGPFPELARRARALYRLTARRGAERPSLLMLAVEQQFGDERARKRALGDWEALEGWIVRNGPYSTEPLLRHEELERTLEEVSAVLPSPFVTKRLVDLYVARYEAATPGQSQVRGLANAAARRREVTGYLIIRAYLRADDFEGAVAALERVELDPPIAKLAEIMRDAMGPRRSALPLLGLAEQFVPEADADASQPYVQQGWGITQVLSRRAIASFPKDPFAHLLRARCLANDGLDQAAIVHLRKTLALKEDVFDAWEALANLEQRHLQQLAQKRPEKAAARLAELEELHARAMKLWPDRPIEPGLSEAYYTVAQGLYEIGEVDRAESLLERSLGIEPVAPSLDLLGTIAFKRARFEQAQSRFESLVSLPHASDAAALQWEARARQQLGEIALRRGDTAGSTRYMRMALRHTNDLLARPTSGSDERAARHVERGKLLFYLGDIDLAMEDFRRASAIAPGNVKAYADPLRYVVSHGYYDEARSIFSRALAQPELSSTLKLYFVLWMKDLAARQNQPTDPEIDAFLRDYDGSGWDLQLARHARGETTFEDLLARAGDRGERAEAYFYEGLRLYRTGSPAKGKRLLERVLDTQMMGFFEYDMAQTYLDWGEVPQRARPPMKGR